MSSRRLPSPWAVAWTLIGCLAACGGDASSGAAGDGAAEGGAPGATRALSDAGTEAEGEAGSEAEIEAESDREREAGSEAATERDRDRDVRRVTLPAPGEHLLVDLAPRAPCSGSTLFERVPSSVSGITFRHRWTDDPQYLHVLGNAMSGGGVAVGDCDGDDLPEVLFTRPVGGARLYRNLGDFTFDDVTERAGLLAEGWGGGATFADVDDDGDLDLTVCGYDTPDRLYRNRGDGTFEERGAEAGLAFRGASIGFAFADVDLDGDLDAYLLTNRFSPNDVPDRPVPTRDGRIYIPDDLLEQFDLLADPSGNVSVITAGQADHLLLNDGRGTFTDVTARSGISGFHFGLSATFFDPDDDLWPDLYVANDFFGPDRLYRNLRDGTFAETAAASFARTPWFSMGSDAGDVDNDGRVDLFASDMASTTHARRMTAMGDVWRTRWYLERSRPNQAVRNALSLNDGVGRFLEASQMAGLSASDWTWSTLFGDLDADGRLDLFVSNGMSRDYFNSDLRGAAAGYAADYMRAFWAEAEPLRDRNLAFRNEGDLSFASVGPAWGLDRAAASFGAVLCDLDRDGDLDVLSNDFDDEASLYRNGSTAGHVLLVRLVASRSAPDGVGAEITIETPADDPAHSLTGRQVRQLTLTHGYMAGSEARVHFGLGAHDVVDTLRVRWPSGHVQTLHDVPADRLLVLAEPDGEPPARVDPPRPQPLFALAEGPSANEAPYDDFKKQTLLPWKLSTQGPGLALGDLDGDGDDDCWRGGPAGCAGVLLANDAGALQPRESTALSVDDYYEDLGGLLFDVDADGDLDLYVASGGNEASAGGGALRDRLYLGDGAFGFAKAKKGTIPELRESGGPLCAADLDRDGLLDVFVGGRAVPGAYPAAAPSRVLRNTGGALVDATSELAPGLADVGLVQGATFADLDDDGREDLALAIAWGPVRVLRGSDAGLVDATDAAGTSALTGLWNGVTAGDVDDDGDLDLVVTNLGLNTPIQADTGAPYTLYHGDVDGSGEEQLVESTYADGVEVPARCLDCVRDALPVLGMAFGTYASYGAASLADVYGADVLAGLPRLSVSELRHGVLLNDGRGAFTFRPLPRRAQVAPAFGAALLAADDDGHVDLVLAQNFSSAQPEAGRWNGGLGLLLRGDGRGGFAPVSAAESGIVIPDDGRGVALGDLDGDGRSDVVVACSDGPLRVGLRRGAADATVSGESGASARTRSPALHVRLVGAPGNASAVGARVTTMLRDGTSRVAEVGAGGGYLAQSSATLAFGVPRDAVTSLRVRWPDGTTSEHALGGGDASGDASAGVVVLRRE
ncbi:MAG: VCBS repeat-containing protein [Planctomycetes bacterium]|nr:VCBS repeat-containing protein [Planctomycetota bacterium]